MAEQSNTTSDALSKQVSELSGQIKEALRRSDAAWRDALIARLETERLRNELNQAQEDLEAVQKENHSLRTERDEALERVELLESQNLKLRLEVNRLEKSMKQLQKRIGQFEDVLHKQGIAFPSGEQNMSNTEGVALSDDEAGSEAA